MRIVGRRSSSPSLRAGVTALRAASRLLVVSSVVVGAACQRMSPVASNGPPVVERPSQARASASSDRPPPREEAPSEPLEVRRFWELIDDSRAVSEGDNDAQAEALRRRLDGLDREALVAFNAVWWGYRLALGRREDLWGAIYTIRGGCSDDCHMDFVVWLIGQGQEVVNAVVRDPERLAEATAAWPDAPTNEALLYVPSSALEDRFGDLDVEPLSIPEVASWPPDGMAPGLEWSREVLHAHFPKLVERYWDGESSPPP